MTTVYITEKKDKHPVLAAILSLILPGLGQVLAGKIRRGVLLLLSVITLIGLIVWRINLLAHLEPTAVEKLIKAFSRSPGYIILIFGGLLFVWAWNVRDAWLLNMPDRRGSTVLFVIVLILFFTVGWQISEIDLVKMARELPDAWPPLSKILWPWEAAITYDEELITANAEILVNDEQNPPIRELQVEGVPFIKATPNYGRMTERDENNKDIAGDTIVIEGTGFQPDTFTELWWKDSGGNQFRPRMNREYVSVITDENGSFSFDLVIPFRMIPPSAAGQQIHQVEARQTFQVGGPLASDPLKLTIELMIETIFMGMMATFFGILISVPISFLAAKNLMSGSWMSKAVYYLVRGIMNIIRSIEPMIWALIAVVWVGLGPFAGILALTIHTIAALGKLYSEAIENIDPGPIEAIQATGATRLQTILFAVVPQMIPPFVSFTIYRWDINVRMSTVIGMVGGGGIGFLLVQYIRLLDYKAAGIAVWFIAITVSILDYVSAEIRQKFI
jgi:phosphonate transport system permease protein